MNESIQWTLKTGTTTVDCPSFPYAFRAAFNSIRKASEAGQSAAALMKGISIIGPANSKGERKTYSYTSATELATNQGLLTPDGQINSKEFKKKF